MIKKGKRIYLRPLRIDDAELMHEGYQDQELKYMTGTEEEFTLEQIETHIKSCISNQTRHDFAICLNETDQLIGELSVLDIEEEDEAAGFRISMLAQNLTGKGYGPEAIKLVLDFVFNDLKLNRLQLEVYSYNLKGIKAYKKAGFVMEGTKRQAIKIRNEFADEIIMSVIKEDYFK